MQLTKLALFVQPEDDSPQPDSVLTTTQGTGTETVTRDRDRDRGFRLSQLWCKHEYGLPIADRDRAYVECQKCGKQSDGVSIGTLIRRDTTPRDRTKFVVPIRKAYVASPAPLTAIPVPQDRGAWSALILRREYGQYAGRAFALSPDCDWVISVDDMGVRVLVPCKKGGA